MRGGDVWARTASHAEPVDEVLRQAVADHDHHVVVGTVDDAIVGYGIARFNVLRDGGRLGVIGDLYVEPDFRGVGVGEAMMGLLVDWCEDQGCFGVDSVALPGNRETKNFFETFGLVARALVVHRAFDREDRVGHGSDEAAPDDATPDESPDRTDEAPGEGSEGPDGAA